MGDGYCGVAPFWKAAVGGLFGLAVGVVGLSMGFWAAVLVLVLILVGAVVGAIACGPND
ncbi:MAG TPA: hypothetical protein DGT21_09515 [Armatimonadetes bacterium]|jgi:uncharacterized membrane protein|nr:hypothetical protein [Armatimonadota bacterium]